MVCIILAAGYATRMYPLTENFPKPLLQVGKKTILDWIVDDVSNYGINDFVVISNHKFIDHFNNWAKTKTRVITVIDDLSTTNENRLGAVRDINLAIKKQNIKEDVLVLAGDNVLDFSFGSFIDYAKIKKTSCIMRYYEPTIKPDKKYCVCSTSDDDKVLYMKEKVLNPQSHYLVPPFYYYKKEDLNLIEKALNDNCPYDAPGSLVEYLCSKTTFHAMLMPGKRYDVGSIETYNQIKESYKGITENQSL